MAVKNLRIVGYTIVPDVIFYELIFQSIIFFFELTTVWKIATLSPSHPHPHPQLKAFLIRPYENESFTAFVCCRGEWVVWTFHLGGESHASGSCPCHVSTDRGQSAQSLQQGWQQVHCQTGQALFWGTVVNFWSFFLPVSSQKWFMDSFSLEVWVVAD